MDATKAYTLAFVLIAVALPLISYGSTGGAELLSTVGLGSIIVAGSIPLVVRYLESPVTA